MNRPLIALGCFSLAAVFVSAQIPSPATSSANAAEATSPVTFHSDLLDFSFTYPGSLVAEKLPSLDEQHAETARKQPPDEKPEYRKADQCTDVALRAHRTDDPKHATGTIAFYGGDRKPDFKLNPVVNATLLISRIGAECLPAEYQPHLDDIASQMAQGDVDEKDLKPIDQPIWYEVGSTRVHLVAAQSAAPAKDGSVRWVVGIALLSNRSLVLIHIESDDLAFLNELLHGNLALGKQVPVRLFSAEIGNGQRLPLKP